MKALWTHVVVKADTNTVMEFQRYRAVCRGCFVPTCSTKQGITVLLHVSLTGEGLVYTVGKIGGHTVVATKLPRIGHGQGATVSAGNNITRLLGILLVWGTSGEHTQIAFFICVCCNHEKF